MRSVQPQAVSDEKDVAMRGVYCSLVGILIAVLVSACSDPDQATSLTTLRIGILPDVSEPDLRRRYTPLFDYLSEQTGMPYQLTIPPTYGDLVDCFRDGEIDLAHFGGFTFLRASTAHDAVPLVMRDVDTRFSSVFLISGDNSAQAFSDLSGTKFGFGSRLSTSGHLMPRFFMQSEKGIVPEQYFSVVRYSGKHDRTAYWVRDGEVDAGVANAAIIRKMFADGRLAPGEVRILWETPPFADYVWAVRPELGETAREKIRQAFLKLSKDDPVHAAILSSVNAGGFLPANMRDFSQLRAIVVKLGLLDP